MGSPVDDRHFRLRRFQQKTMIGIFLSYFRENPFSFVSFSTNFANRKRNRMLNLKTHTVMKKFMFTLIAMFAIAMQADAMSYEQARREALFLTDKMAYELNLTDAQYEAAYEINLDYLMSVTHQDNVFGPYWERRNLDLSYILYSWQWDTFCAATYFYRPLFWEAGYWHFGVYARYPHRDYYYFGRPHFYATYRGGHSWRMNGGHSYYEHRHDTYRPHVEHNNHIGMRDGWNHGNSRQDAGRGRGNSSTRITGTTPGRTGRTYSSGQHSGNYNSGQHSGNTHRPTISTSRATGKISGSHSLGRISNTHSLGKVSNNHSLGKISNTRSVSKPASRASSGSRSSGRRR